MGTDFGRPAGRDQIGGAIRSVAAINLALAAAALFKDIFMASYLGTSAEADALVLAYFIPDTVGNNLLASALGVACIPLFSRLYVAGDSRRLAGAVSACTVLFAAAATALTMFFYLGGRAVVDGLGAGMEKGARDLCLSLLAIILPALPLYPLVNIWGAALQVHNRFIFPALAPVLFNLVLLGSVLFLYLGSIPVQSGVHMVAGAILAGTAAMAATNLLAARRHRIGILAPPGRAVLLASWPDLKAVFSIFLPYLMILLTFQLVYAVERYLASGLEVGSIAGLNYAFRMSQFPLWVFVSAVSAVAYPSMAKATGTGRTGELRETAARSMWMVFAVTVPVAACMFILRVPAVSILLQRGSFDQYSVEITAGILAGYALGIVPQGVAAICLRAYLAAGKYHVPLMAMAASAGVNIALDFVLVARNGSAGLGYGAAAGALAGACILMFLLKRDLVPELALSPVKLAGMLAANLPVLLVAGLAYKAWPLVGGAGPLGRLGYALGVVTLGLTLYLAGLRVAGLKEFVFKRVD